MMRSTRSCPSFRPSRTPWAPDLAKRDQQMRTLQQRKAIMPSKRVQNALQEATTKRESKPLGTLVAEGNSNMKIREEKGLPRSITPQVWRSAMTRILSFIAIGLLAHTVRPAMAQERIEIEAALSTWDGQAIPTELYGFRSLPEAERALVCILNVSGLNPDNFEIAAANVPNAAAATLPPGCGSETVPCERALLYNPDFMHRVHAATDNGWSAISILAHEVGHHLQGHTIRPGGSNPRDELQADEYSGFVLRKLGATIDDAQAVFRTLPPEYDGGSTHPARDARETAVANGWTRAHRTGDGDVSCYNPNSTATQRTEVKPPDPAVPTATPPGAANTPEATFGSVTLSAGFEPDPYSRELIGGGEIGGLSILGDGCSGYVADSPDFHLTWTGSSPQLRIFFTRYESGDPTLLVRLPDGSWACGDDTSGTLDPMVVVTRPLPGEYLIWVGSYDPNEYTGGLLHITELDIDPRFIRGSH